MTAILNKADGEIKQINSKVHIFIATHPFWATVISLAVGFVVGFIIGKA